MFGQEATTVGENATKLVELKKTSSKNDKFLLYRMNLKELTGEETYVFKTSDISLKILNSIDRDHGSDMMSKQCCFFDAKENRVRGMSTYTLSVYHPLLRQQIPLATMDCVGETFINAITFFQNLNTALTEKFGVATQFNPCRFILDERGCNWRAISAVYGPDYLKRCFSCEFQFQFQFQLCQQEKEHCYFLLLMQAVNNSNCLPFLCLRYKQKLTL